MSTLSARTLQELETLKGQFPDDVTPSYRITIGGSGAPSLIMPPLGVAIESADREIREEPDWYFGGCADVLQDGSVIKDAALHSVCSRYWRAMAARMRAVASEADKVRNGAGERARAIADEWATKAEQLPDVVGKPPDWFAVVPTWVKVAGGVASVVVILRFLGFDGPYLLALARGDK